MSTTEDSSAAVRGSGSNDLLGPLVMPGQFADCCGQRWRVGAVGVTGGERYYWLSRPLITLMVPATMVKPWEKRSLRERFSAWRERTGFFMDGSDGGM